MKSIHRPGRFAVTLASAALLALPLAACGGRDTDEMEKLARAEAAAQRAEQAAARAEKAAGSVQAPMMVDAEEPAPQQGGVMPGDAVDTAADQTARDNPQPADDGNG